MAGEKAKSTHWALRAVAVCVGVIFVLFGGVCVAACVSMLLKGANAPAAAKVGVTVQIVATAIFALVALCGVFLIWVGLRRGTASAAAAELPVERAAPPAKIPAASAPRRDEFAACVSALRGGVEAELEESDRGPAVILTPDESRPADPALGRFLAHCGPEKNGETYNYVAAGIYLALALASVLAPGFIELKIDAALAYKIALIPAGIGVAMALVYLWDPLFAAPHTIELYEHGMVERLGNQVRSVELAAIERLRLQEWYEHRFADRTFNVKAQVHGQRQLAFNTALRGQGELIVDYLASQVPQTEFVEFA